jgi:hypothetical protein
VTNARHSPAYNAREQIPGERTGEVFNFRHRDAPEHHEVMLPEGAMPGSPTSAVLRNAAETRKDARGCPRERADERANSGLSTELARSLLDDGSIAQLPRPTRPCGRARGLLEFLQGAYRDPYDARAVTRGESRLIRL